MTTNYSDLDDKHLLALCIWRESRGETIEAQIGVACSIRNRVNSPCWWGHDYRSVILKPYQYSSFNESDPNYPKFPDWVSTIGIHCLAMAAGVIEGDINDPTDGATHYYDNSLDNNPPKWAKDAIQTIVLGHLRFFKGIK